ncbi:MAG: hypothetical protein KZQ58_07865 [gamma proteobacterium symbiont of Bathyaustriella thionipta]|nr:hypothetical protein [gamma proteobacterium symbiont of Bathyaustriella thionipta]
MAAQAMGIRSFVALPIEKGGAVLRLIDEQNTSTDTNIMAANVAYGISGKQALFMGLPYRLSSGDGDRLGDVSLLYRHIVWQVDDLQGTSRLGLLGGLVLPTDKERDVRLQAGAVATFYRQRHEWDLDALWIEGRGIIEDRARYDIAWQYRLSPAQHEGWGVGNEWDIDLELGGRWQRGDSMVHQATAGLQYITRRWVMEGAVVRDLNGPDDTRFLFSTRVHF